MRVAFWLYGPEAEAFDAAQARALGLATIPAIAKRAALLGLPLLATSQPGDVAAVPQVRA